jgi:signal transduction histidine kinase/DNA-binding NarL/FixJ family response regulator
MTAHELFVSQSRDTPRLKTYTFDKVVNFFVPEILSIKTDDVHDIDNIPDVNGVHSDKHLVYTDITFLCTIIITSTLACIMCLITLYIFDECTAGRVITLCCITFIYPALPLYRFIGHTHKGRHLIFNYLLFVVTCIQFSFNIQSGSIDGLGFMYVSLATIILATHIFCWRMTIIWVIFGILTSTLPLILHVCKVLVTTPMNQTYEVIFRIIILIYLVVIVMIMYYLQNAATAQCIQRMDTLRTTAVVANQAKSKFLSYMSHELRTPMNGILGLTELALQPGTSTQDLIHMIEDTHESALTLVNLLNSVLDINTIDSKKMTLCMNPFSLTQMFDCTLRSMTGLAHKNGITIIPPNLDEIPHSYVGDGLRLRQILLNLLGNALKFTPCGGTITISVTVVTCKDINQELTHCDVISSTSSKIRDDVGAPTRNPDDVTLRISISDTGPGIPISQAGKLFKAYEQGNTPQQLAGAICGTGLGLAISASLVHLFKGVMWVRYPFRKNDPFSANNNSPRGSEFVFTVCLRKIVAPIQSSYQKTHIPVPEQKILNIQCHGSMRVLVVDDSEINRKILGKQLTSSGYQFLMVESGEIALDMIKAVTTCGTGFDIVLMDLNMPGMGGLEITQVLRQWETMGTLNAVSYLKPNVFTSHQHLTPLASRRLERRIKHFTPVVACTAQAFDDDKLACKAAGMNGFLSKPYNMTKLETLIDSVILNVDAESQWYD